MTTAILAAERWLNNGPFPARRHWRRVTGAAVLALGVAAMLGLLVGFVVMMLLDTTLG